MSEDSRTVKDSVGMGLDVNDVRLTVKAKDWVSWPHSDTAGSLMSLRVRIRTPVEVWDYYYYS